MCAALCFEELSATGSNPEKTEVPQACDIACMHEMFSHVRALCFEELSATGQHPEKTEAAAIGKAQCVLMHALCTQAMTSILSSEVEDRLEEVFPDHVNSRCMCV